MEDVADFGDAVGACEADDGRGGIVGGWEQGDGVAQARFAFEPCFEPFVALGPRVLFVPPIEDFGVRADSKDVLAVGGGEGPEEETLGGDWVAGTVHRWWG